MRLLVRIFNASELLHCSNIPPLAVYDDPELQFVDGDIDGTVNRFAAVLIHYFHKKDGFRYMAKRMQVSLSLPVLTLPRRADGAPCLYAAGRPMDG